MKILEEVDDRRSLAILYNNIGSIYSNEEEHSKALEYFDKALELKEEIGERFRIAHTLTNIGTVYLNLKDYDKSLEYFLQSLNIQEEIGDRYASVDTLLNISTVKGSYNRFSEALEYTQRGLSIAEELGVPYLKISCYESFSTIYEKMGDFKKALEYHKQYKEVNDRIFTEESNKKYNELRVSYETEKTERENEIYRLRNTELAEANEELKRAISEVRKLSGLLPICSSCKKIRDDSGYWEQIEEYISERSDAQFSHGLCPECIRKLYPEYSDSHG